MEIPGAGESTVKPSWKGKSWGLGGQTGKNPPWKGYGNFLEPYNRKKSISFINYYKNHFRQL